MAGVQDAAQQAATSYFMENCPERHRFRVLEIIGKGAYGTVCAAIDHHTGEKVAIKRIQNVFDNVADAQRILREIKLLRMLQHPDVVEIKHIVLPPDPRTYKDVYVVFELMESDLHTVIGANDDLTADHHRVFLYQLLRGLKFVHEMGVLHRDLKPKNILANSDCKLKICDLGLARPFLGDLGDSSMCAAWTDYVATRYYRAPELCGCFYGRYSQAVDIWSIGCLFAETLLGRPLFPGRDAVSQLQLITDLVGKPDYQVIERISNRKARDFLHALPPKPGMPFEQKFRNADRLALDLLQQLLAFDSCQRPTAAQALEHPYFANLPKVGPTEGPPVSVQEFEFELHKLSEADVRNLIYLEALNYHPHVMAQYSIPTGQLRPIVSQVEMDASSDMRRQFYLAEHHGRGGANAGAGAVGAAGGMDQQGYQCSGVLDKQQARHQYHMGATGAVEVSDQQAGCVDLHGRYAHGGVDQRQGCYQPTQAVHHSRAQQRPGVAGAAHGQNVRGMYCTADAVARAAVVVSASQVPDQRHDTALLQQQYSAGNAAALQQQVYGQHQSSTGAATAALQAYHQRKAAAAAAAHAQHAAALYSNDQSWGGTA